MAKKNSAMKKLVAAAAMLGVSTTMLSGATYAWFTMSREVEVTGIKMTATVPEDLQISVGVITAGKNLNDSDSYLTQAGEAGAPTAAIMWSNTLDISQYYKFGKLIPASSDTGENIFFTPDANGVGKTEKVNAMYYQASTGLAESGTYQATLHYITGSDDEWAPSGATSYSVTNDDGYYVDIPVWLRTSSKENVQLSVSGFVTTATGTHNDDADVELYRATRVAILPGEDTDGSGTAGIMDLKDGSGTGWASPTSIINYYGTSGTHGVADGAVFAAGQAPGSITYDASGTAIINPHTTWSSIYRAYTPYTDGTAVVTVNAASANQEYSAGNLVWIRVWLEGEDPECWNQNAGQDWNISLRFTKIEN